MYWTYSILSLNFIRSMISSPIMYLLRWKCLLLPRRAWNSVSMLNSLALVWIGIPRQRLKMSLLSSVFSDLSSYDSLTLQCQPSSPTLPWTWLRPSVALRSPAWLFWPGDEEGWLSHSMEKLCSHPATLMRESWENSHLMHSKHYSIQTF